MKNESSAIKRFLDKKVTRKSHNLNKSEWLYGYLLITPLLTGLMIFLFIPMIQSFYMSLTDWNVLNEPKFIGLQNYKTAFTDKGILRELYNTIYYTIGTVPAGIFISTFIAYLLSKNLRGTSIYKTIYFLPIITMSAAIAIVWQWMFNSKMGLVNEFLRIFGIKGPMWLGDPKWIMPAIIIVSVWKSIGNNVIILMAGLRDIPTTYYEAAEIDGAKGWHKFWYITIPLLTPTLFFLSTMGLIGSLKVFDLIMLFNNGATSGPMLEATKTIVYGIYTNGFTFLKMGYASAEAVLLFVLIMIVTGIQFFFQKKWVHYY